MILAALIAFSFVFARVAESHEVVPSIADLWLEDKQVVMKIRTSGEAILAEIDLSQVEDTNDAENAAQYDTLRQELPDVIEGKIKSAWIDISEKFELVTENGEPLSLVITSVRVDPVGNTELPRFTHLELAADTQQTGQTVTGVQFSWAADLGGLILRQQGVENGLTQFLQNAEQSDLIENSDRAAQSGWRVFADYVPVGFAHIIPMGLDHILFVLGLFFFSPKLRPLLWQISAFTLAHTVTLAAGALGWIVVVPSIVEPLIAASIAYVAIENIFVTRMSKWRPLVIFGFGLLHGLGFASVLGEFGLPQAQFIPALVGFNIGVEFGQLAVVAGAFLAVGLWFGKKTFYRSVIAIPSSMVIAAVGLYWCVERVMG